MNTRKLLANTLSAVVIAVGVVLSTAPAQAAGGTRSVEEVDFVNPNHLLDVCGFPVSLHVRGTFNVVTFLDDNGDIAKEIRNYRFRGTLSANGVSIEGLARGPEIWTYDEDATATVQIHGVVNRRVPGQGTVTLHAGYQVVLIDGDTETVVVEPTGQAENAAELCSLFS